MNFLTSNFANLYKFLGSSLENPRKKWTMPDSGISSFIDDIYFGYNKRKHLHFKSARFKSYPSDILEKNNDHVIRYVGNISHQLIKRVNLTIRDHDDFENDNFSKRYKCSSVITPHQLIPENFYFLLPE